MKSTDSQFNSKAQVRQARTVGKVGVWAAEGEDKEKHEEYEGDHPTQDYTGHAIGGAHALGTCNREN